MVQVISNLGRSNTSFSAVTVVRPVLVSVAFVVILPVLCCYLVQPATVYCNHLRESHPGGNFDVLLRRRETALVLHTSLLLALATGSSYAGTSNLFAAYLAGAIISWWDSDAPHVKSLEGAEGNSHCSTSNQATSSATSSATEQDVTSNTPSSTSRPQMRANPTTSSNSPLSQSKEVDNSGLEIYHICYQSSVEHILKPFFFASIGFSIPISSMFSGSVIWRGIIYSILMALGKLACGFWLLRFSVPKISSPWENIKLSQLIGNIPILSFCFRDRKGKGKWRQTSSNDVALSTSRPTRTTRQDHQPQHSTPSSSTSTPKAAKATPTTSSTNKLTTPQAPKPRSLYPAALVSCAMVARGEVGFLISSLAQSKGLFAAASTSPNAEQGQDQDHPDIYLIVTWAIFLCTVIGPLGVGLLVRRVRALEKETRVRNGGGEGLRGVLGVWM